MTLLEIKHVDDNYFRNSYAFVYVCEIWEICVCDILPWLSQKHET